MKKFKRIICVVLTIITCFSAFACSGSCLRSCKRVIWSNLINLGREEAGKQKAALDSVQKQVDGYKLIVDYTKKEYEIENGWVKLENINTSYEIGIYHGIYNGNLAVGRISVGVEDTIYLQVEEGGEVVEKEIRIDYSICLKQYRAIDSYEGGRIFMHLYCCDDSWFLICVTQKEYRLSSRRYYLSSKIVPPLFYLLDFENNTMYYAGYADGWYENAAKMDYLGDLGCWHFDITKVEKI